MSGSPFAKFSGSNHEATINETILVLRHRHPVALRARLWRFDQGTKQICEEYHRDRLLIFSYRFPSYCLDRKYTRQVLALHLFLFPSLFQGRCVRAENTF